MSDIQAADPQINTSTNPANHAAQPADPSATPTDPKPTQQDTSWVPKRIGEITAARRAAEQRAAEEAQARAAAEAENARLREQLAALNGGGAPTPGATPAAPAGQNFDQLVQARATALARQQAEQQTFNQRIAAINEAGTKEFGEDFEQSVSNLQMAGIGGPEFLKVLTNVPKAEALVTWLGKSDNLNEAMRLAALDPVQMAIELTKLSPKAAKEVGKQISKAPPPIDPVTGAGGAPDGTAPDPKDTKAWMEWRNKNRKTRR